MRLIGSWGSRSLIVGFGRRGGGLGGRMGGVIESFFSLLLLYHSALLCYLWVVLRFDMVGAEILTLSSLSLLLPLPSSPLTRISPLLVLYFCFSLQHSGC